MSLIEDILSASGKRLAERQRKEPLCEVQRRAADAPKAATSFREALEASAFSIIAEIKGASPSSGAMDRTNVQTALETYDATDSVSAISMRGRKPFLHEVMIPSGSLGLTEDHVAVPVFVRSIDVKKRISEPVIGVVDQGIMAQIGVGLFAVLGGLP
jgi:indole-3-glycerol phosphate synthase